MSSKKKDAEPPSLFDNLDMFVPETASGAPSAQAPVKYDTHGLTGAHRKGGGGTPYGGGSGTGRTSQ